MRYEGMVSIDCYYEHPTRILRGNDEPLKDVLSNGLQPSSLPR